MTNGDKIRSMDNMTLAVLFHTMLSERDRIIVEKFSAAGCDADLIEMPVVSVRAHFQYLESEVGESNE